MSQIVGTQAVLNVLTGKRWSVVSAEMKDYLAGYYGKAPGPLSSNILEKVLGEREPLDPDVPPSTLITTTYDEVAAEIGDLAHNEEDVLMYALFPETARAFLTKHRAEERTTFLFEKEASSIKEEEYVDISQIKDLIKVVEDSDIGEVTVEEAGMKITVVGKGERKDPSLAQALLSESPDTEPPPPAPSKGDDGVVRPHDWVAVRSPMIGTFYAAPSPTSEPFVKLGDEVMAGATLCIVEAMKLMNEVSADRMGVVKEICVENAEPVEYDTVLFYLEPVGQQIA
jgi:oxaloacetate decarboxylase alpha subunit